MEKNQQQPQENYSAASNTGKPFEKQDPIEREGLNEQRKPGQPIEEESDDYADEEEDVKTDEKNWK